MIIIKTKNVFVDIFWKFSWATIDSSNPVILEESEGWPRFEFFILASDAATEAVRGQALLPRMQ